MAKWFVVPVTCVILAGTIGCGSRKQTTNVVAPQPTAGTQQAATTTIQTPQRPPANVPGYRILRVQDSMTNFTDSGTTALKKTYDVLVADGASSDDIFKVIQDLQIRETTRDPNIDWMFFNVYDNELDAGAAPTRGTAVWAEFVGSGARVSEEAASKNDHSANRLSISSRSYARAVRYTNGDGFDIRSNTITPFEDDLYSAAEELYAQNAAQPANADLIVADRLSKELGLPRSMVIRLHRKVKQLKASGVEVTPAAG